MREPLPTAADAAKSSWLHWTGGLFGAIYVVITILLLPRLGAATLLALFVTGQMIASLAFDHYGLFGLTRQPADATAPVGRGVAGGGRGAYQALGTAKRLSAIPPNLPFAKTRFLPA